MPYVNDGSVSLKPFYRAPPSLITRRNKEEHFLFVGVSQKFMFSCLLYNSLGKHTEASYATAFQFFIHDQNIDVWYQ